MKKSYGNLPQETARGQKTPIAERFAAKIANHPVYALLAALVLLVTCVAGLRFLQPDFTYRAFFGPQDKLRLQVEEFEKNFSNDDSIVLVVHSPSGILDAESSKLIVSLTERMWKVPDVIRVDSLSNFSWVRSQGDDIVVEPMIPDTGLSAEALVQERSGAISKEPLIGNYLLSADGKTTMIVGNVRPDTETTADAEPILAEVRKMIADHQIGDHTFHITGRMAVMAGMQESAQSDVQSTMPIVLLTVVIILGFATRRIGGVVTPLILIVFSIVSTMGLAGWLGFKISNVTAMIPQFILAIGVADSVHILMSYYRIKSVGFGQKAAIELSMRENFTPTVLTAFTTAIGFLTAGSTNIVAIENLGVMVGLGVFVAWLFTFLFLGAVFSLVPDFNFSKAAKLKASTSSNQYTVADAHILEEALKPWGWLPPYVAFLRRFSLPIVAVAVLLSLGSVWIALSNTINSNPFNYFDKSFWLRQSSDFAEANLSGSQGIEVAIDSGVKDGIKDPAFLAKVEQLQSWVSELEGVVKTVSVIDFIKQTNKSFNGDDQSKYVLPTDQKEIAELLLLYSLNLPQGMDLSNRVSLDNDKLRLSVRWTLYDSAAATLMADKIEEKAAQLGLNAQTTGKMLLMQRMNSYVSKSMLISLGLTIVLISIVLLAIFRSIKTGFVALIVNLMPLSLGLAVLTLAGRDIDTGAVVVLSVCLGIAVDDTIHMLQAIRSSKRLNLDETIVHAIRHVLPAVIVTTLILVIGFGAFMFGKFVPNQNFGLMAVTILSAALIYEIVVLPALYMLMSKSTKTVAPAGASLTQQAVTT